MCDEFTTTSGSELSLVSISGLYARWRNYSETRSFHYLLTATHTTAAWWGAYVICQGSNKRVASPIVVRTSLEARVDYSPLVGQEVLANRQNSHIWFLIDM